MQKRHSKLACVNQNHPIMPLYKPHGGELWLACVFPLSRLLMLYSHAYFQDIFMQRGLVSNSYRVFTALKIIWSLWAANILPFLLATPGLMTVSSGVQHQLGPRRNMQRLLQCCHWLAWAYFALYVTSCMTTQVQWRTWIGMQLVTTSATQAYKLKFAQLLLCHHALHVHMQTAINYTFCLIVLMMPIEEGSGCGTKPVLQWHLHESYHVSCTGLEGSTVHHHDQLSIRRRNRLCKSGKVLMSTLLPKQSH